MKKKKKNYFLLKKFIGIVPIRKYVSSWLAIDKNVENFSNEFSFVSGKWFFFLYILYESHIFLYFIYIIEGKKYIHTYILIGW